MRVAALPARDSISLLLSHRLSVSGPADSGIWYGAEAQRTACAELGFWRWRFLIDSEALETIGPSPQTVFRAGIDGRMIDLTRPPFKRWRADWTHPDDYGPTQSFARVAHQAAIDAIRYESVRDPEHGPAEAVLQPIVLQAHASLWRRRPGS